MTPQQALTELAIATNHAGYNPEVEAVYLKEIAGRDTRDVVAACRRLGRSAQFWPKLSELIVAINEAADARHRVTRGAEDIGKTDHCRICKDAKWLIRECSGPPERECGRGEKGRTITAMCADGKPRDFYVASCQGPHTYSTRCTCHDAYGHNPLQPMPKVS